MLERAHVWTEDNHAEAVEMWSEGRTTSQIADFFCISRSAVGGYISRNRSVFPTRKNPVRKDGKAVPERKPSAWTEERLAIAARLWKAGWTEAEVADQMGCSKAAFALTKKRYRAVFDGERAKPTLEQKPKRVKREVPPNLDELFEQSEGKAAADGRRFILAWREPVAFIDLRPTQCKFPASAPDEPNGPDTPCCGAERAMGMPYCLAHAAISYRGRA